LFVGTHASGNVGKSTISTGRDLEVNSARTLKFTTGSNTGAFASEGHFQFSHGTNGDLVRITADGKVGIGVTGPRASLEISDGSTNTAGEAVNELYVVGATTIGSEGIVTIQSNDSLAADKGGSIAFGGRAVSASTAGANWAIINGFKENASSANYAGYLSFNTRASGGAFSERARLDSSGRLLVGTSTNITSQQIQSASTGGNNFGASRFTNGLGGCDILLTKSRGATVGTHTVVQSGDDLGNLYFGGSDGSSYVNAARISAAVDGTPGANDMPGRLVFSTTADGAELLRRSG
jgi:hypothetical protein